MMRPADYAQAQLDCYNQLDLEGFLALYADDVVVHEFPATPVLEGKAALRERYGRILFPGSTVHAVVTQRMVVGNRVIDHEQITGHPIMGEAALVVIYQVGAQGIERVWFMR
ncbi:steroid Delta-isomerase [Chitinimonas prasina]|uniref:Steroid Delta-isomerase n=1 Tax=Chitinimonas prasina TaxID=1434937 RepID=A0ABQ5YAQ7_9NEIS|nr:nuclear transport factor 2 family protein [Chitinimonas prasina]GLR12035.1 steroid Delta-isomerase [Chitinimonas prasina]